MLLYTDPFDTCYHFLESVRSTLSALAASFDAIHYHEYTLLTPSGHSGSCAPRPPRCSQLSLGDYSPMRACLALLAPAVLAMIRVYFEGVLLSYLTGCSLTPRGQRPTKNILRLPGQALGQTHE